MIAPACFKSSCRRESLLSVQCAVTFSLSRKIYLYGLFSWNVVVVNDDSFSYVEPKSKNNIN